MINYGSKRLGKIGKRFGNSLDGVCKSGLDYYLSVLMLKTSFSVQKIILGHK